MGPGPVPGGAPPATVKGPPPRARPPRPAVIPTGSVASPGLLSYQLARSPPLDCCGSNWLGRPPGLLSSQLAGSPPLDCSNSQLAGSPPVLLQLPTGSVPIPNPQPPTGSALARLPLSNLRSRKAPPDLAALSCVDLRYKMNILLMAVPPLPGPRPIPVAYASPIPLCCLVFGVASSKTHSSYARKQLPAATARFSFWQP